MNLAAHLDAVPTALSTAGASDIDPIVCRSMARLPRRPNGLGVGVETAAGPRDIRGTLPRSSSVALRSLDSGNQAGELERGIAWGLEARTTRSNNGLCAAQHRRMVGEDWDGSESSEVRPESLFAFCSGSVETTKSSNYVEGRSE